MPTSNPILNVGLCSASRAAAGAQELTSVPMSKAGRLATLMAAAAHIQKPQSRGSLYGPGDLNFDVIWSDHVMSTRPGSRCRSGGNCEDQTRSVIRNTVLGVVFRRKHTHTEQRTFFPGGSGDPTVSIGNHHNWHKASSRQDGT